MTTRFRTLLPALAAALLAPAVLRAADPIQDDANLFTAPARQQAKVVVRKIQDFNRLDLLVETMPGIPADQARRYRESKPTQREQFFTHWAEERAAATRTDGIYVLICQEPLRVRVISRKGELSRRECQEIRSLLEHRFERGLYDEGLVEGVRLVREQLDWHARGSPWIWIGWLLAGALGLWVGVGVVARIKLAEPELPDGEVGVQRTGTGLPGGLMAALGGYWLYRSLFCSDTCDPYIPPAAESQEPIPAHAEEHPPSMYADDVLSGHPAQPDAEHPIDEGYQAHT